MALRHLIELRFLSLKSRIGQSTVHFEHFKVWLIDLIPLGAVLHKSRKVARFLLQVSWNLLIQLEVNPGSDVCTTVLEGSLGIQFRIRNLANLLTLVLFCFRGHPNWVILV